MALVLKDRVRETTTTTGTGTITLTGGVFGYQSFSSIGSGNTTYYCIAGQSTSEWEVGIGTYTLIGTTLSRDTILASSNSGSVVTFSAGTKDVFVVYPAGKSVNLDASGNATFPAGTAALPSITTSGDTNTGVYFPAADTVGITTGGSERMRIDSFGRVGIGVSPSAPLEVASSGAGVATIRLPGPSADNNWAGGIRFYSNDGTTVRNELLNSSNGMLFYTAATERMRINSSGNVGVGVTPSPWNTVTAIQVKNAGYGGYLNTGYVTANCYFDGAVWKYIATDYAVRYDLNIATDSHVWYTAPSGTAGAAITFTERMKLTSTGLAVTGALSCSTNLTVTGGTVTTGSTTALSLATSGAGTIQAAVTHTASASRYITLTGSNGGNPTIGTSAGNLSVSTALDVSGAINSLGEIYSFNANAVIRATSSSGPSIRMYAGVVTILETTTNDNLIIRTNSVQVATFTASGSFGVMTSGVPDASAILDAQSTTKGVRMPNMTTTQKNAISSPAAGLMVFDTTLAKLCVYSGTAWQTITSV